MIKTINKIALLTSFTILSGCNATIDHGLDKGKELLDHSFEKASALKTETVNELGQKLEIIIPKATQLISTTLESFLNSNLVAFLVVSNSIIIAILAISLARIAWKKLT